VVGKNSEKVEPAICEEKVLVQILRALAYNDKTFDTGNAAFTESYGKGNWKDVAK
jgi:hypothetical protein